MPVYYTGHSHELPRTSLAVIPMPYSSFPMQHREFLTRRLAGHLLTLLITSYYSLLTNQAVAFIRCSRLQNPARGNINNQRRRRPPDRRGGNPRYLRYQAFQILTTTGADRRADRPAA